MRETFDKKVCDPKRYQRRLIDLSRKYAQSGRSLKCFQDGVNLSDMAQASSEVARLVARSVARSSYEFSPALLRFVLLDKVRLLYRFEWTDLLVHGVVAETLSSALAPNLSPHLYSYRKGISQYSAGLNFAQYLAKHRGEREDLKTRGLYVLRLDVQKYTEEIPVGERAPLWSQLDELVSGSQLLSRLLRDIVRPVAKDTSGILFTPIRGVPTGSPISTLIANLYLSELDAKLSEISGAFYARFGDDLIFAHPNREEAMLALKITHDELSRLGLEVNPLKKKALFFNGAGRSSSDGESWRGSSVIEYLGINFSFNGNQDLSNKKRSALLQDLRTRLGVAARLLGKCSDSERAECYVAIANVVFNPDCKLHHPYSVPLIREVNDRNALRQLDYQIALMISQVCTGVRGVKSFRNLSYRTLRRKFGLKSLVLRRNGKTP